MALLKDTIVTGSLRVTDTTYTTDLILSGSKTARYALIAPTSDGAPTFRALTNADVGLGNVENTKLSTWAGTNKITTVGTIGTGTWQGTTVGTAYGGTGNTSFTQWGVIYANPATKLVSTAAGTSGYLLQGNGSAAPSWIQATNANTASTIVKRDASGNFSAGTITAALSGNASTATALTSNAGSTSSPIYFTNGKPSACNKPKSGAWYSSVPVINSDGVMEIGKYIDFHDGNTITADYTVRIMATSTGLTLTGTTSGTFSGDLTGNVTGNCSGSSGSCTGNAATATSASSLGGMVKIVKRDDFSTANAGEGWKRVAKLTGTRTGHTYLVMLYSSYNSPHDFSAMFSITCGYTCASITQISNSGNRQQYTRVRCLREGTGDTSNYWLEFYHTATNYDNSPICIIMNFDGSDITTYQFTNTDNNGTVDCDLYISAGGLSTLQVYLGKGKGIYWDPYVESASDASDAASIYQIVGGVAGGTELRIQQANDSNDVINICSPYYIYLNSKRAFDIHDSWLRINESSGFSSGVYFGGGTGGVVRTDNQFQVGDSGNKFYANSSGNGYFSGTLEVAGDIKTGSGRRIGNSGGALYIGNSGNQSWVYVQDICSQDEQKWTIRTNGTAKFSGTVTAPTFSGNASTATRINGDLGSISDSNAHNIWVSSTTSADGIPKYISGVTIIPSSKTLYINNVCCTNVYSPNYTYHLAMQNDGNLVIYSGSGGAVWSTGTSTKYVKENINSITDIDISNFMRINPVSFNYKPEMNMFYNSKHYGVIAEELLDIYPNLVEIPENYDQAKFDINKGFNQPLIRVNYEGFIPLLIKMVQNQQLEIQELREKINKLNT